jgi:hypothetical protein
MTERELFLGLAAQIVTAHMSNNAVAPDQRNCCGGITYKFCARVEMMSSVAD